MSVAYRPLVLLLLLTATFDAAAQEPTVPVRLFDDAAPETLILSADDGRFRFFTDDGSPHPLIELQDGEQATIRTRDDELYVQTDDLSFFALSLRAVPDDDATLRVEVQGISPRHYAGTLRLAPDAETAVRLVNQVPLEDYVAAVVAREYGFDDLEGAKAMAVLARTYALRRVEAGEPLADHVLAQQYDGADRVTAAAREAARQTQGQVLTYLGDLIDAVYFSSSGGHTANNEDVWDGQPLPYLRGVADPYDAGSPHASWRTTVPRDRLLHILSDAYDFEVEGFLLGDRSRDGRVRTIDLLHGDQPPRTIRSNEFRLLVNRHLGKTHLKSTLFDARREGNRYVFTGQGFGHGVGLCQYGALEMSRREHTYRDILAFYFTDVSLEQQGSALPAVADQEIPAPSWAAPVQPVSAQPEKRTATRRRVGW